MNSKPKRILLRISSVLMLLAALPMLLWCLNLIDNAATPDDLIRNLMDFTEDWNSRFLSAVEEVDLDRLLKR